MITINHFNWPIARGFRSLALAICHVCPGSSIGTIVTHTDLRTTILTNNLPSVSSVSIQPTRMIQNNPKMHMRQSLSLHK